MTVTDADLDEIDLSVTNAIMILYDAGASRAQAERALRERIGIMFDALDDFEEASRPEGLPIWPDIKRRVH